MRISFDLDQTLISNTDEFETEKINLLQRILGVEKIRKGTVELFKYLELEGHDILVYTTSFRNPIKIKLNFRTYGLKMVEIVNQRKNSFVLKKEGIKASKYPPAFNTDVHVGDYEGVGIEGDVYNYKTIIVSPNDKTWVNSVKNKLKML